MPTVKLRDGDITLNTRGDSANCYAGYRLADGGRLQESLKKRSKAEAGERAIGRYDEFEWRSMLGLTPDTVSFAQAADAWIEALEGEAAAGTRKAPTAASAKRTRSRCITPVAHPARHWRNGSKTPASADPKYRSRAIQPRTLVSAG
jgi:hypothetical protein